ncbi:MAG: outer membrane beta-barrel protein [Candidatus Zixiibacteriota bacterium]
MSKRDMMIKIFIILMAGVIFLSPASSALELVKKNFSDKNFAGARLGVWTNLGDKDAPEASGIDMEFDNSSVYGEFFYAFRVAPPLAVEISLGLYSRGDVLYSYETSTYIGAVNLYPVFLSAKLYPFYKLESLPFYPYAQPGVGFVYGSQSVIDYDDYYYYYYGYTAEDTETRFTYILGGGIDWPVASNIGLTASYKYMPVKFGEALAGVRDYSGWTLTIGVGYIF